ncbi:MAG: ABC transporter substrate-binding protein, partial [Pseudomonadota bacterium]
NGTMVTFPPNLRQQEGARSILVEKMGLESEGPNDRALFALSAVEAWAQAAERVGTTNPTAVAAELRQAEFDTALGQIGFDSNGDVTGFETFSWFIWQDGILEEFQPK